MNEQLINAMSVDVEDYFQVSAFEKVVLRSAWPDTALRVERNIDRILQLFSDHDVKATFFTLGWLATRLPTMVLKIAEAGHEIASHGMDHQRVTDLDPKSFRADIRQSKQLLEDISGQEVLGYRAPSYSIGRDNLWALDELASSGFLYSSSIYPIKHDHYGMPEAPRFAFRPRKHDLIEIPVTTVNAFGKKIPCGGGGYFRLYPYMFSRWAIRRVNECDHQAAVFYFHPWEIDPDQPRVSGLSGKSKFRHYLNLTRMEGRLAQLVSDFSWDRMDHVYAPLISHR